MSMDDYKIITCLPAHTATLPSVINKNVTVGFLTHVSYILLSGSQETFRSSAFFLN